MPRAVKGDGIYIIDADGNAIWMPPAGPPSAAWIIQTRMSDK